MRTQVAGVLAVLALLGGCREADRETGARDDERAGADTIIESETIKDTTIVTADTSIDVDTVKQTDRIDNDTQ